MATINSEPESAPPKPRKARKKQAVGRRVNAATKAIMRSNAQNSPLLSLPAEIRVEILKLLVTGGVVHIDLIGRARYNEYLPKKPSSISHAICTASERDSYEFHSNDERYSKFGSEPSDNGSHGYNPRHAYCKLDYLQRLDLSKAGLKNGIFHRVLHMGILGTSRQLYQEGNHILWSTNTFAFKSPWALRSFVNILNPMQKRSLTSILISIYPYFTNDWMGDNWKYYVAPWHLERKSKVLIGLRNVKSLHLQIYCRSEPSLSRERKTSKLRHIFNEVCALRSLRLKDATVTLTDEDSIIHKPENDESSAISEKIFTATQIKALEEELKAYLLDPAEIDANHSSII